MGEPFRHRLRVRYHECDPQGVVFNANYLAYFDIAITELWREAFGGWDEAMAEAGLDAVVAEATVRYRAPLRFDEEFDLEVQVVNLGTTSMTTAISCVRDGTVAAEGEVRHVFVDGETREKTRISESVRAVLARFTG